MAKLDLYLPPGPALAEQARQITALATSSELEPQAIGGSVESLLGAYALTAVRTEELMGREGARANHMLYGAVSNERDVLQGIVRVDLQPDVRFLQWPINPRLGLRVPFAYAQLPHIDRYLESVTDARRDPYGAHLASAGSQALNICKSDVGFSATVVPGTPPGQDSARQPTDYLHQIAQEHLGMNPIAVGHFAVRAANGRVDIGLLETTATLYARTSKPGRPGLNELRYGPNDFRDVLAKYS